MDTEDAEVDSAKPIDATASEINITNRQQQNTNFRIQGAKCGMTSIYSLKIFFNSFLKFSPIVLLGNLSINFMY